MGHGRKGVTLIEILVVLGIITILIGVLLPSLMKARLNARNVQEENSIKQLTFVCAAYAAESGGWWPLGARTGPDLDTPASDDLAWINIDTFELLLRYSTNPGISGQWRAQSYLGSPAPGLIPPSFACNSLASNETAFNQIVGAHNSYDGSATFNGTRLGFNYWARRNSLVGGMIWDLNGSPTGRPYPKFPDRQWVGGTQILFSCPNFSGPLWGYELPHSSFLDSYAVSRLPDYSMTSPNLSASKSVRDVCFGYTDSHVERVPHSALLWMGGSTEWVLVDGKE